MAPRATAPLRRRRASSVALKKRRLGDLLLESDVVAPDSIEAALEYGEKQGVRIGEALVKLGLAEEKDIVAALSQQTLRPTLASIPIDSVDLDLYTQLPISFAKTHQVLPLWIDEDDGSVAVAVADPFAMSPVDDLRVLLDRSMRPWIAAPTAIKEATNRIYDRLARSAGQVIEELEDEKSEEDHLLEEIEDIVDSDDDAPIIRFVNSLLTEALKERVSDIHFEPFERTMQVRFRIDGILYNKVEAPKRLQAAISSRVKVMAQLDIAEKRLPQDGRIRIKVAGRDVDIRVSTVPVAHGERIVLRLQDRSAGLLNLDQIGIEGPKLPGWREHIRRPHGILLVTGPTGSGKTTTLYASISEVNRPDINILTVEDPIEYQMKGIGQMAVNPKIDLTFARGLRAYLRQDPDVILVGEIRDLETAEIAIQASLTGHLVLSTLHTNDAATAVNRLVDMGVEPFLVASSLTAVMAQRLLRRLCSTCKESYTPDPPSMIEVGIDPDEAASHTVYRPKEGGCEECLGTGYRGRTGIYELLTVNDTMRSMIVQNLSSSEIRQAAIDAGMTTLRMDGASKFLQGHTSLEEVIRITQDDSTILEDASVA
ncbi:MAG: type II secretion system ATPase GspE [Deltaproteobacteria bacterium]|nr:type II secretion system ATPase GspE [Deltaproteobacteria bacterium]